MLFGVDDVIKKEPFGWAVRIGPAMKSSFRTRAQAVREAECLCNELRQHGVQVEMLIEGSGGSVGPRRAESLSAARLTELLRQLRPPSRP